MKTTYSSVLVDEATRLTERIIKQAQSPTLRASIYNRCLESLGLIQEKAWEATDAKWTEVLTAVQDERDALKAEIDRLNRGDFTAEEVHGFCHKIRTTVPREQFEQGCRDYQEKIYGGVR